eukprot:COSAG02_NODE_1524_length_12129_cov_3.373067_2_plen_682_part_00
MEANDHEQSEQDDGFNYMTREEQRREDVEAIEESIESIVLHGGPLHRFIPMITNILTHELPAQSSRNAVKAQASAVVALGKFMVNSRQLAKGQIKVITAVLSRSHHSSVKHAALSVLADMTMFVPNHPTLHRENGQCFLTELLDDKLLGRAALSQLLRLCNIRVVHATAHLGALAAAMQYDDNVASIMAFFANYFRTNGKQGRSTKQTKARLIYKTYCDFPSNLTNEHKRSIMVQLITSFCDLGAEKELSTLLAKRLIEHVDPTAAYLLYARRTASVAAAPALVTQIEQRNLAALVVRIPIAKDEALTDLERSELQSATCVTQSLYKLLSLPIAQKLLSATSRTADRSCALSAAVKHLSSVTNQIAALDVFKQGENVAANLDSGNNVLETNHTSPDRLTADQVILSKPRMRVSRDTRANPDVCSPSVQTAASAGQDAIGDLGVAHDGDSDPETVSGNELYSKIRHILSTADYNTLTKKKIRALLANELSARFVEANEDAINQMVVDATKQQLANADSAQTSKRCVNSLVPKCFAGATTSHDIGRMGVSNKRDACTSAIPVLSEHGSASVDCDASSSASGWAGMEEEEEKEEEEREHEPLADTADFKSPRMREFLEAAVAVAGSAVKRSAGCMPVTPTEDSNDNAHAASSFVVKRQHFTGDEDGDDAHTDDSLSLGSALEDS